MEVSDKAEVVARDLLGFGNIKTLRQQIKTYFLSRKHNKRFDR